MVEAIDTKTSDNQQNIDDDQQDNSPVSLEPPRKWVTNLLNTFLSSFLFCVYRKLMSNI